MPIHSYKYFAFCFVWVLKLVAHVKGGMETEGV